MTEFLQGIGLVCATWLGAAAVALGLRAGLEAANWAFGPFTINIKRGDLNVFVRDSRDDTDGSIQK